MTQSNSDGSGDKPELIDPEQFPSWIVEEDDGILAINKPGLVVCHPSKQGPWSSLIGASREYLQQELVHLVHRLDRETSGICLLAKDKLRARHTQMAFQNLQVSKEYLALLEGELVEPVHVTNHLAKDLESEVYIKQAVRKSRTSKRAETGFEPLLVRNGHTLVRVIPKTGRKHQIRIHAQHLGYPIVGDKMYGPDDRLYLEFIEHGYTPEMANILGFHRQALHAHRVYFDAPEFKRSFTAPLVEDMADEIKKRLTCSEEELVQLIDGMG